MLASEVYESIQAIARTDTRGSSFGLKEYNAIAPIVNSKIYQKYLNSQDNDALASFRKTQQSVTLVAGGNAAMPYSKGDCPSDFYWICGKPLSVYAGTPKYLDQVTPLEVADRYSDYLTQPTTENPVYMLVEGATYPYAFVVYPSSITTIYIDYYRTANTPFLDYYITNATLKVTYLQNGVSHTVTSAETYRDGTTGAKTSATVDWEWAEEDKPLIIALFLQEIGINIPDELLIEAGLLKQNETEA